MSIRKNCPCDIDGVCPYDATYNCDCEYWCGEDEPEDPPYEEPEEYKMDLNKLDSLTSKLWDYVIKNDLIMSDIEYIYTKIIHKYFVTFNILTD